MYITYIYMYVVSTSHGRQPSDILLRIDVAVRVLVPEVISASRASSQSRILTRPPNVSVAVGPGRIRLAQGQDFLESVWRCCGENGRGTCLGILARHRSSLAHRTIGWLGFAIKAVEGDDLCQGSLKRRALRSPLLNLLAGHLGWQGKHLRALGT